jgi:hypothetical protein
VWINSHEFEATNKTIVVNRAIQVIFDSALSYEIYLQSLGLC